MFNKAAVTGGSGGSRCTLIRPQFRKQKSGEGCVAPLSFEESFSKIVLKIYGCDGREYVYMGQQLNGQTAEQQT